MKKIEFPSDLFSFGAELECADVPRTIKIPPSLGSWEHSEADIVNTLPPYRGICADPKGIDPPVGGEVNTYPTKTSEEQVDKIMQIVDLFTNRGYPPQVCPTSHIHFHIHVTGLKENIAALKRLTQYVKDNQEIFIRSVYHWDDSCDFSGLPKAKMYMRMDGARMMPGWMADNIINKAKNFDDFIFLHCAGKDGVSRGRPIRYGINMYCLKHTSTIEFRCFRGTFDRAEIEDSISICETFIWNALNYGLPMNTVLESGGYSFPKMTFSRDLLQGWMTTKKETDPKWKNRVYHEIG